MLAYALLILSGLFSPATAYADSPNHEYLRTANCRSFLKKLPAEYFRGWVSVPENYQDPQSRKIRVFYYGIQAPGFRNPIVFFNGGPGYANHDRTLVGLAKDRQRADAYSFLYIDQRGNGCSDPYPHGADRESILRLRFYGSSGIVHDAEAVRRKLLGEQKWKIFGQSYGAFVVHRYVTLFPQSIDKAYAHANAISTNPFTRLLERISSQARVWQIYLQRYPEDKIKFERLRDLAEAGTCLDLPNGRRSCGYANIENLFLSSLGFSDFWLQMHSDLRAIVPDNAVNLKTWAELVSVYAEPPTTDSYDNGMAVIAFYDRNILGNTEENCRKVYAELERRGAGEHKLLFNECQDAIQKHTQSTRSQRLRALIGEEKNLLTLADFRAGLEKLAPDSFYLYSGELDTFVPKETVAAEAEAMGNLLRYTHFQNSGHEGFYTEDQIFDDLLK